MEYSFQKLVQSPASITLFTLILILSAFSIFLIYRLIALICLNSELRYCNKKIMSLEKFQPLKLQVDEVVYHASDQEIIALGKILRKSSFNRSNIIDLIRSAGSHSVASLLRRLQDRPAYVPYRKVLKDVGNAVGVTNPATLNDIQLESAIVENQFEQTLEKMSEADRKDLESKLAELAAKHGKSYKGLASVTGSMAVAQASGFGIYLMASTLVGAMTNLVGITLPFLFYTAMSKTIAICFTPLGWGFLGLWGIHKLGSPNLKKTIPSVIMITAIRQRLEVDREQELSEIRDYATTLLHRKNYLSNVFINQFNKIKKYNVFGEK